MIGALYVFRHNMASFFSNASLSRHFLSSNNKDAASKRSPREEEKIWYVFAWGGKESLYWIYKNYIWLLLRGHTSVMWPRKELVYIENFPETWLVHLLSAQHSFQYNSIDFDLIRVLDPTVVCTFTDKRTWTFYFKLFHHIHHQVNLYSVCWSITKLLKCRINLSLSFLKLIGNVLFFLHDN